MSEQIVGHTSKFFKTFPKSKSVENQRRGLADLSHYRFRRSLKTFLFG